MKVGIVGGGIAGLTAAIALGDEHDVTLFERAEAFTAAGAGIVVSANAGRALRSIGVDLTDAGRRLAVSTLARADGTPLQVVDLTADAGRLGPTVASSRSELHRHLVDALPSKVDVRLGRPVESVDPGRSAVTVAGTTWSFDLLVGADGINSAVRAALPRSGRVVPAGVACWRALVAPTAEHGPVEYVGSGARVGVVGLASGTYVYLVESARPGTRRDLPVADVRARFTGFPAAAPFLDALGQVRFDDLHELDRPIWGDDRTVLVGDAAHAMTPNLGQGASMGIEDAVVLGRCLRDGGPGWFDGFLRERTRRVRWVQLTSRRLGRVLHVRSAPARWVRDGLLRSVPASVTNRQSERLLGGGPVPANAA